MPTNVVHDIALAAVVLQLLLIPPYSNAQQTTPSIFQTVVQSAPATATTTVAVVPACPVINFNATRLRAACAWYSGDLCRSCLEALLIEAAPGFHHIEVASVEEAQAFAFRCAAVSAGGLLAIIPTQLMGLLRCNITDVVNAVRSNPDKLYIPSSLRSAFEEFNPELSATIKYVDPVVSSSTSAGMYVALTRPLLQINHYLAIYAKYTFEQHVSRYTYACLS
jgi:hypothetical protein